jgi:hypothetical protein
MNITESSKEKVFLSLNVKNLFILIFTFITIVTFYIPLKELIMLSLSYDELYSHIVLIPLISGYFIYSERKTITKVVISGTGYGYTIDNFTFANPSATIPEASTVLLMGISILSLAFVRRNRMDAFR